ncbi:EamA family transporter, partial [Candidatus Saccharibacteria bacterium]|nr:EamA family transporter [Candidatus Saccharibacteria bacterium]
LLLSGMLSSLSGIPYYRALEIDDSTNIGIFIQLAPILYLILGCFFLGETISPSHFIAFFIIIAAPLLIVLSSRKRSRKTKLRAIFFAFLYILIAVISNLIFVKANTESIDFVSEIAILFLGKGIANLLIIYSYPKWRKRFLTVVKSSKRKVLRPLISNTIIGVIKDFAYRGALITAPVVALASAAADSSEPIVIFFMGLVLTLIWPKFGREKLNKKSVLVHLTATILVVAGVILLQF